jgi:hypothetical protein
VRSRREREDPAPAVAADLLGSSVATNQLRMRFAVAAIGGAMPDPQPPSGDFPLGPDGLPDLPLRVLEDDETVPPRPEETLADWERTDPESP